MVRVFALGSSLVLVALAAASCGDDPEGVDPTSGTSSSGGSSSSSSGTSGDVTPGSRCVSDEGCEGRCVDGACAAPTITDGRRSPSLDETDVDCGGKLAPGCAEGKSCKLDADCANKACAPNGVCTLAPSCKTGGSGLDTCGNAEPGTADAVVESCCKSLPLPKTPARRLDKYEITAGRLRAFISGLAAAGGGEPDVRGFAKQFAAAHPTSQLGTVASGFPGLLDVLPNKKSPTADLPLPVHLGAFPLDPINELDGCFVGPNAFGHPTYWQEPADLKPFGVGYPTANPDGVRKYSREQLDAKAMNCVMPLLLAAFCAWDGGELARTSDYREVWGRNPVTVQTATVFVPWAELLPIGKFNWRNGHGEACTIPGWPGCQNPQPTHYRFPATGPTPANDDSGAIGAPGRFPLDRTKAVSANGEGWLDIGGNLMEAAWPNGATKPSAIKDVCDASAGAGGPACTRPATGRSGIRRYTGDLPQIALVGYSFEGHARRSEAYLAATADDEMTLAAGDLKPVTFQYGKVGGRCARPAP